MFKVAAGARSREPSGALCGVQHRPRLTDGTDGTLCAYTHAMFAWLKSLHA